MKKPSFDSLTLYPVLFPANIVLTLAAANLVNLSTREIIGATAVICLLVGLIFGLVYLLTRNGQRSAFLVFVGTLWAAYFGVVVSIIKSHTALSMNGIQQLTFFIIWSAFFATIGSNWVWKHVRKPGMITSYLNILMIVLIGISVYRIVLFQRGLIDQNKYGNVFPMINSLQLPTNPPDIYYIILDGYGEASMLNDIYGWDNTEFTDYLAKKGFFIAVESQANYVQTGLSLSSSLNFEYLPDLPQNSVDMHPQVYFILHNRLFQTLESMGYKTYTFQTPYEPTNITQVNDYYIGTQLSRMNGLSGLLMINSVLTVPMEFDLIRSPIPTYGEQQDLVVNNLAQLERIAEIPGPKLVFLHIVLPHPPFIFDTSGPVSSDSIYILADAQWFPGTTQQYVSGYVAQTEYLNHLLMKSLDTVLSRSSSPPIVILQGDHGPGADFHQTQDETCLKERFSILNAYLLPGANPTGLYPSISPVNTFRLVFDRYFGTNLGLLPDLHYYSNFFQPYRFVHVIDDEINKSLCDFP